MKIYTKKGDKGLTFLADGKRVSKADLRICACGDIDELNAVLGLCRAENDDRFLGGVLSKIQGELFVAGADLSLPADTGKKYPRIGRAATKRLETSIDLIEKKLPPLKNFILPAGSDGACFLHLARTVCRRAERSVVALAGQSVAGPNARAERRAGGDNINPEIIVYLNRLGDLLFVMARLANKTEKIKEEIWRG